MGEKTQNAVMNDVMSILMFIQGLKFGGLEKIVCDLMLNLKKNKINVVICCYDKIGDFVGKLIKENIKVRFLPRKQGIDLFYPFKLASLIKKQNIRIIHAHNATAWFYATWASILSGIPIVYTEHDRSFPTPLRLKYFHYFFGKHAAAVIAVSKAVKENLKKYEHIKNVKVIYNGIDPDLFKPASVKEKVLKKKQLGLNENDFVLGNVGRMDYWKNQRILIEILPELKNSFSHLPIHSSTHSLIHPFTNIKLILVGGGEEEGNLKNLAIKKGVENDVIFLSQRSDVNQILKAFDTFVFPSLTEGLPLVVIEAMATGLPVVASHVGGIPELVVHGETGFLVSPTSKEEIKEVIIKLLNNPKLRKEMGQIARKRFEAYFSLPQMVQKYMEVYEEVVRKFKC